MKQIVLPMMANGDDTTRAPLRAYTQAFGFDGNIYDEYLIIGSNGGESDESGETLFHEKVYHIQKHLVCGELVHNSSTEINMYVNKNGEAFKSWKGKLKSGPVCNFHTGKVFKYVRN